MWATSASTPRYVLMILSAPVPLALTPPAAEGDNSEEGEESPGDK